MKGEKPREGGAMHREEKEITLEDTWDKVVSFRGKVTRLKENLTPLITEERAEIKPDPWRTSTQQKSAEEEVKMEELERIEKSIGLVEELSNKSPIIEMEVNLFSGDGGEGIELEDEWEKILYSIDGMFEKMNEMRDSLSTTLNSETLNSEVVPL